MERKRKRHFSDKMEKFCLAYVETANAAESYRIAYNTENMATATIGREGYNTLQKPQVQARLEELRKKVMERHEITVDTLLAELEEARKAALDAETPQTSAAVSATMGKAKLLGLDKKIVEITGKNGGDIKTTSTVTVSEKVMNSIIDRL
ncbi:MULTISPECIES: terminase small subunit [Pseudomonas]|uniref:Terminase small subunit n=1 Tax=Pseudomonas proteolytica TaxID=219574 RepID=A0AAW5A569_9PSED|nr:MULTISPECIES: terminase small subunit [Pseudomonas]KAA8702471.1 terminase small subunit [Pseudomonas proteolytica]MCF5057514.1 terminase small subunit [Pseudomonas proteolytica]MCF5101903.1 terminase small subunit [Pseudomonas proteolytica]PHN61173.1 terminase [Pseudomonas sp. ICMP 8385]TWR76230.1 terminase small subunit [Pseudomonas proteolytica]